MKITVVPLSVKSAMTMEAWSHIQTADRLYLQSALHPFAKTISAMDCTPITMDDLYEASEDFDTLWRSVAERLLAAGGDCVYAATGETGSLLAVLRPMAQQIDVQIEVLPGVSMAGAAFPEEQIAASFPAELLPAALHVAEPLAVTEIDSALRAGEVKLKLMEFWPDDWRVRLAYPGKSGGYAAKELSLCEIDRQKRYDAATVLYVPAAPFDALTRYGFPELCAVLERLRAPGGCPWDREQTHESLRQSLLEECYEVIDAIDREDDEALVEELGDVLMQVVFHAAIGASQGRFDMRDVTTGIVEKLVYRHPHVFGTVHADTSEEVLRNWEKLKQKEKHQQTQTDTMQSVPRCFPALMRSRKVQKKAAAVGFDWPSAEEAFPKIQEETEELREAMQTGAGMDEEMGDLLFAVVNVARLLHQDPEFLLAAATDKFIDRFSRMEKLAASRGQKLEDMPLSEQDTLWNEIKNHRS